MRYCTVFSILVIQALGCDSSCQLPKCLCPSRQPPGGLKVSEMPQFVMLTYDDSIFEPNVDWMLEVFKGIESKCPIPATMFLTTDNTNFDRVRDLIRRGWEIADHTMSHVGSPGVNEIVGARDKIVSTLNLPKGTVNGFRAPYLQYTPAQYPILHQNDFKYDSSVTSYPTTSEEMTNRMYPFTLDFGSPLTCTDGSKCLQSLRLPGLWQIPMLTYDDPTGKPIASMDPENHTLIIDSFYRSYRGNRAPFGIWLHSPWLQPAGRIEALRAMIQEMAKQPNVYFVTMQQLLDFMERPIPIPKFKGFDCEVQTLEVKDEASSAVKITGSFILALIFIGLFH